jgi:hypothetical protein
MNLISESWKYLNPLTIDGNIENFEKYYNRIMQESKFSHIPKLVFEQWIWAHHNKIESIENYGWLNYENIEFELCSWSNEQLTNVYVIESYREYYDGRASINDINNFTCLEEDLEEWREKGTWRIPPIILDIKSIEEQIPDDCDLVPPFQLVEGHSRLGYLHSMNTMNKLGKQKVAKEHNIYLMKIKSKKALQSLYNK